jgi:hypothetical protein
MKAAAIFLAGLIVLAFGTLFTLQGAGVVHWPRESFMLDQREWVERGLVIALAGLALILTAWRINRK